MSDGEYWIKTIIKEKKELISEFLEDVKLIPHQDEHIENLLNNLVLKWEKMLKV